MGKICGKGSYFLLQHLVTLLGFQFEDRKGPPDLAFKTNDDNRTFGLKYGQKLVKVGVSLCGLFLLQLPSKTF